MIPPARGEEVSPAQSMLLGEWLLLRSLVSRPDLEAALAKSRSHAIRVGDALVFLGFLNRKRVEQEIALRRWFFQKKKAAERAGPLDDLFESASPAAPTTPVATSTSLAAGNILLPCSGTIETGEVRTAPPTPAAAVELREEQDAAPPSVATSVERLPAAVQNTAPAPAAPDATRAIETTAPATPDETQAVETTAPVAMRGAQSAASPSVGTGVEQTTVAENVAPPTTGRISTSVGTIIGLLAGSALGVLVFRLLVHLKLL